jgi:hypothetical protein
MRQESKTPWWSRHRFIIGLAVVLVFSAAARLFQIDGFSGNYDEGVYLMIAWLQTKGFPLYSQVIIAKPPMLFQPIAWLFAVWGPSSTAARCVEIGYALLGIAAVAWAGRLIWQPATGLAAALFLSLEAYYFVYSRKYIGTASSAAVGALAVFFALCFQASGRRRWLLLAGVVLSFSLLIKPISLFVGLLLLWVIIARRRREIPAAVAGRHFFFSFPWREVLLDCLCVGAAGMILPILCLVVYDGPAMLRAAVSMPVYQVQRTMYSRITYLLIDYAPHNRPLLLLAALGAIQTIRRRNGLGGTVIVWLVLNLAFTVVTQAQQHHLTLLDLPLALLAAQPIGELINLARTRHLRPVPWSGLAAALLLVYYLVALPALLSFYLSERPRGPGQPGDDQRREAIRLLQEVTTPDQFIVGDDQEVAFEARRMAIPELVDTSFVVIRSGFLTEQAIMQWADRQASAFIFWTQRLDSFPMLPVWVSSAYVKHEDFGEQQMIYYSKRIPHMTRSLNLAFGGEIALAGYELSPDTPSKVTLYWRRLGTQGGDDYQVWLCLLDRAGNVVRQHDYQPYSGHFPTTAWPVGVLLPERTSLPPTDGLPPGEYSLVIGLYDPDKLELLSVSGGSAQNHLALLQVFSLGNR